MKKIIRCSVLLLLLTTSSVFSQIPQTMSYQGVLTDASGTAVADGDYSLTFNLYESATGGNSIWGETQDIAVVNGLFNAILGSVNPLSNSFDRPYWLGIAIGSDAELEPRIELTASAYSLNARSVADSAVTGDKIADGQVVRSLNGVMDEVVLSAGENIQLSVDGQTVTISASGQVAESRNTLDAADGDPVDAVFVDDDGNVGIGTGSPVTKLTVVGGTDVKPAGGGFVTVGSTSSLNIAIDNNEIMARSNGSTATLYLNVDGGAIILGGASGGNVGIGTETPSEKLHLNTASGTDMKIFFSEGGIRAASLFYEGSAGGGTNNLIHMRSEISGNEANMMTWKLNGNVGIGTTSPPQKLSVDGTIESQSGGFKFPDGTVQATAAGGGSGDGHSLDAADGSPTDVVFVDNVGWVGIGTNNPGAKLDINGSLRWKPVTRHITIHPAAFTAKTTSPTLPLYNINPQKGLQALNPPLPLIGPLQTWLVSISLPDGATMETFRLVYIDDDPDFNFTAKLIRQRLSDGTLSTMAQTTTTGSSSSIRNRTDSTITNKFVDNGQFVYSVTLNLAPGIKHYLTAIRIEYSIDRPH